MKYHFSSVYRIAPFVEEDQNSTNTYTQTQTHTQTHEKIRLSIDLYCFIRVKPAPRNCQLTSGCRTAVSTGDEFERVGGK